MKRDASDHAPMPMLMPLTMWADNISMVLHSGAVHVIKLKTLVSEQALLLLRQIDT